ncbi:MAG TPA: hypothetical protein VH561_07195 [Micromonosporaceae bacterium]
MTMSRLGRGVSTQESMMVMDRHVDAAPRAVELVAGQGRRVR